MVTETTLLVKKLAEKKVVFRKGHSLYRAKLNGEDKLLTLCRKKALYGSWRLLPKRQWENIWNYHHRLS
jgi:hypothetical protein